MWLRNYIHSVFQLDNYNHTYRYIANYHKSNLFIAPNEVTGLNLTCELSQSELYYNCTAEWNVSTCDQA